MSPRDLGLFSYCGSTRTVRSPHGAPGAAPRPAARAAQGSARPPRSVAQIPSGLFVAMSLVISSTCWRPRFLMPGTSPGWMRQRELPGTQHHVLPGCPGPLAALPVPLHLSRCSVLVGYGTPGVWAVLSTLLPEAEPADPLYVPAQPSAPPDVTGMSLRSAALLTSRASHVSCGSAVLGATSNPPLTGGACPALVRFVSSPAFTRRFGFVVSDLAIIVS